MKRFLLTVLPLLLLSTCAVAQDDAPPEEPTRPPDVLKVLRKTTQKHLYMGPCIIDMQWTVSNSKIGQNGMWVKMRRNDGTHFVSDFDTPGGPFDIYVNGTKKVMYAKDINVYGPPPAGMAVDPLYDLARRIEGVLKTNKGREASVRSQITLKADVLDDQPVYVIFMRPTAAARKKGDSDLINMVVEQETGLIRRMRFADVKENILVEATYELQSKRYPANTFTFTPPAGARRETRPPWLSAK